MLLDRQCHNNNNECWTLVAFAGLSKLIKALQSYRRLVVADFSNPSAPIFSILRDTFNENRFHTVLVTDIPLGRIEV